ncbi:hypothetical protein H6G33_09485 [Calothrix sp. FACHB-1219]|uniref:hypothetical protein n=1 Tax=unclassified Calothrix TaxID=2619626 RepID=UPI0016887433|nr:MULTISPECIES: hypothetical protein [unclassified Calothrix]MBD2201578.1 hypothetical protein [Calothrix sp. FACHB-168]MBD2217264.1 hypothetical protein [Calothrix sp. FACHB-1219]
MVLTRKGTNESYRKAHTAHRMFKFRLNTSTLSWEDRQTLLEEKTRERLSYLEKEGKTIERLFIQVLNDNEDEYDELIDFLDEDSPNNSVLLGIDPMWDVYGKEED